MVIERMHYEWEVLYNRIHSNHKKTFSDAEKDTLINRAINEYVEIFYSGENRKRYKLGFEVNQQRIDMLSTLVIGQPAQPMLTPDNFDTTLNIYEFDMVNLIAPYQHYLRGYVKVKDCDDVYKLVLEQTDDISAVLDDANRGPSNRWRRAVMHIKASSNPNTESSFYVYTNGEFEIEGVYIEFLKKPAEVALGTYTDLPTLANPNPSIKPQVNCDLPSSYHDLVVDMAVQEATRILEDVNRLNLRADKITGVAH